VAHGATILKITLRTGLVMLFTLIQLATNVYVVAQCNSPVFSSAPSYAADRGYKSVAVGEFNGDGKLDLAVTNQSSNNISILLGDGFGGFGPPSNFPVPAEPRAIAAADFNKDGKTDLAVAHIFGGPVSVMLGNGNGSFSSPTIVGNTSNPNGLAIADFNHDGNPDIAVSSSGFQLILLGNGSGGFTSHNLNIGSSSVLAASVTAADFNGDGFDDAAFTGDSSGSWRISIVLGNAAGTFSVITTLPVTEAPKGIAVGDFNGDSKPDIVVVGQWAESRATVFINQGANTFTVSTSFLIGSDPRSVTVGDFNADGNADIAVALAQTNNVMIAVGVGQGTFLYPTSYYGTGFTPSSIAVGDFNSDNKLDLVTANAAESFLGSAGSGGVSVLMGKGNASFETYRSYYFDPALRFLQPTAVATADFDNDGQPDLAISYLFSSLINVMRSDGSGGLLPFTGFDTGGTPTSVAFAIADLNGDNNADVVAANDSNGIVRVFFGTGTASFTPVVDIATTTNVKSVAVGDFNGDGKQDIIVTRTDSANALILLGNGAGAFVQPGGTPPPVIEDIVVADFNGDGRSDVAAAHFPPGNISVFLGDPTGHLNLATTTPFPGLITQVRLVSGDLNADGHADVLTANTDRNDISIFLGDGVGGLGSGTNFAAAPRPFALAIADFDGDGKRDVAVANNGGQFVSLFRGIGDGSLMSPTTQPAALNPNDLVQADFNQDGKPDLAVLSGTSSLTSILLNLTTPLPCLSVNDVTVTEGDSGSVNANFIVSLSQPSTQTVRVNYSLVGQTATAGIDFGSLSNRLSFAPGETTKTVSVPIFGDQIDEIDETFKIQLASPFAAAIADAEGVGTILDDDPLPSITINDVSNVEASLSTFTVSLSAVSGKAVTVQFATANGTAVGGTSGTVDYFPTSGTLTIPAGQISAQVGVDVFPDATFEPDETFFLNLSDPTNATISDAQGQSTIVNDDPIPRVDVNGFIITEGNAGTKQASFSVTLSNPTSQFVTLNFATSDDTATAGSDYVATSGTLTFAPEEVQKSIVVLINGDTNDETAEKLFLDITNVQNASTGNSRATGFIIDDDGPAISINDISVVEGNTGTRSATFTLTLSAPSVETITVRATTTSGTASAFSDYTPINFNVAIPAGTVTRTFDVSIIGDTNVESDETFFVNLSNPQNATILDGQGEGTIIDDDGLRLILEESGPATDQAAACDSILLVRDPFRVRSIADWLDQGPDRNTRLIVFAANLQLSQGEPPSAVTVGLIDSSDHNYEVPAEDVRAIPGFEFTQIIFRLPDGLSPGICKVTIKAHGQSSKTGTIRIIQ